ncbi:MAG: sodium:proton antiporter, partial [Planctomycetota bacterium]
PALALIKAAALEGTLFGLPLNASTFYFGTGVLSGVLDNAPTFVAFLAGLEGKTGLSPAEMSASTDPEVAIQLAACAVASVFWGAMTYIGNGPNFMVKAIAESTRDADGEPVVHCPSFFGYVIKYSVPYLLPVLLLTWLLFFSPWKVL